jgi:hypothetical protein
MGKLFGMFSALFAYFCIGTVIAAGIMLGLASSKGYLDKDKLTKMVAIAKGTDAETAVRDTLIKDAGKSNEIPEQPSLAELEAKRALRTRDFELREQALASGLDSLRYEQRKLADEKETYDRVKGSFEKQLAELQSGSKATGRDNIRTIWESIKPKQAKEQVLQMIAAGEQNDIVAIFTAMPTAKRAKIIGEFKSEEESKKLEEILRLIRQGEPEMKVLDKATDQVKQFSSTPRTLAGAGSNERAEILNANKQ